MIQTAEGGTVFALQLFGFLEPTVLIYTSNENRQKSCVNVYECPVAPSEHGFIVMFVIGMFLGTTNCTLDACI